MLHYADNINFQNTCDKIMSDRILSEWSDYVLAFHSFLVEVKTIVSYICAAHAQ